MKAKAVEYATRIADSAGVHPKDKEGYKLALLRHHYKQPCPYLLNKKGFPILKNKRLQFLPQAELLALQDNHEHKRKLSGTYD